MKELPGNLWLRDFQLALRLMRKNPGTTAVIVLALALGIGVNASSFVSVNALILHPLPFPHIDRVMTMWETTPKMRGEREAVAPATFLDWQQQSRSFESIAAYQTMDLNLTGTGDPEHVQACLVSPEYFAVLGRKPLLGRIFREDEVQPGRASAIVVSNGFWERNLASAHDALGRSVSVNGQTYAVVGVMPSDFMFPLGTDIWMPLALTPSQMNDRSTHNLAVIGRLKPDVPAAQARAELDMISRRLEKQYPDTNEGRTGLILPIVELINNVTDRFVLMLWATSGFVLLLACANVANLQLARIIGRQKEMAVRRAVGASSWRIAGQLVVENVTIALAGGILGLVLAAWYLDRANRLIPAQVHKWVAGLDAMRIDTPVVLFTLGASVLAGILCAVPALFDVARRRSTVEINEALKENSRESSIGPRPNRVRNVLATGQVVLALVLLVGAGLMVRTFQRLLTVNCGYDPNNLLISQISLPETKYRTGVQITEFYDALLRNLRTSPDVKAAGIDAWATSSDGVYIQGRAEPRPGEPRPGVLSVSGQYFAAHGLPVVDGRAISDQDVKDSIPVVVLSETVARYYWPAGHAVGNRIRLQKGSSQWLTVVGICGEVKDWFSGQPMPKAYLSFSQAPGPAARVLVRSVREPESAIGALRAALRQADSSQPIFDLKSMHQQIAEETSGVGAAALGMSVYAVIALLLAVTGIYAVISYSVAQRTHEIGIRMALGATGAIVTRMTLRQGLGIVAVGLVIGVPMAFTLMHVLSSVLYNVVLIEPLIFIGLAGMLALSAVLAGYVPARRAARIDPLTALRHD